MKYVKPLNETDANASYKNADPANAQKGSTVPAQAIEHPMREIVNVITAAGLTPSSENLAQLASAIDTLIATGVSGKQDTLFFDDAPTESSSNPVKSGGIYAEINNRATKDADNLSAAGKSLVRRINAPDYGNYAVLATEGNAAFPLTMADNGWILIGLNPNSYLHLYVNGNTLLHTHGNNGTAYYTSMFMKVAAGDVLTRNVSQGTWQVIFFADRD